MEQYLEHPDEEALERFLLHRSEEPEVEIVETHMLACDACVERLEILETQIAATKIALQEFQLEAQRKASAPEKRSWRVWFGTAGLSFAGAVACVALAVGVFSPAEVHLSAYRGVETSLVPEWRPLRMHLHTADLANGPVTVQLVDVRGSEVWKGVSAVRNDKVDVHVPRITNTGNYFLRIYEPRQGGAEGDLLREFAFRVK